MTRRNAQTAIPEASSHNPDIVLLDLGLPDVNGIEVIKKIRNRSNMPIIVISARSEDTDKIEAPDAGCAWLREEELHLTPIEYKILCLLSQNIGRVLTHTDITQHVWGRSWENDVAFLRVFMETLRKKPEPLPVSPQYIQTHVGVGYRMIREE